MKTFPLLDILGTACMLGLILPRQASAETYNWQVIDQPKIDYLSSIGVRPDDVDRILLTGEHDGAWNSFDDTNLRWAYFGGDPLFLVHRTRYLAAPAMPQSLYMLDLHGWLAGSLDDGSTWPLSYQITERDFEDGWYAMAIDPNDGRKEGQHLLFGGPGVIKYRDIANPDDTWHYASIGGSTKQRNTIITDIQYARQSSQYAWAATSEAAGWDDIPSTAGGEIGTRDCLGVLRSANGGQTWDDPYLVSTDIPGANCIYAVAPISSSSVYAATKAGLWLGDYFSGPPAAMSWSEIALPDPFGRSRRISSIFYPQAADSLTFYIGLATGDAELDRVLKTADGGANWVSTSFPAGIKVNALGGTPSNANAFYAAYASGDQFKTTDGGSSPDAISALHGAHAGYPTASVAVPPNQPNDNTLYVSTTCQGGVYKGVYNPKINPSWTWTTKKPAGLHSHFHYAMRLAQDPMSANTIHVTVANSVHRSTDGGDSWTNISPKGCDPQNPEEQCQVHLHGLAVAPSAPATLYVGTGHGTWPGTDSPVPRIWQTTDAGDNWTEVSRDFPPPSAICDEKVSEAGCFSLYTIAVSPNDADRVFVGTFGHENQAGDFNAGRGVGVVRSSSGGLLGWEPPLTAGLCPDKVTAPSVGLPCSGPAPAPPANSLFVGNVAIDRTPKLANVYIATFNGIYKMLETGSTWVDISPNFSAANFAAGTCARFDDCRRFESIDVSPTDPDFLLAGTSQPLNDGDTPAKIFKSTDGGVTWSVWAMPIPPSQGVPYRAWAPQYRIRDIKMGLSRAYAVIEGSGVYKLDVSLQRARPRSTAR